jgi:proteasome lid subunit RPN8/RPN11
MTGHRLHIPWLLWYRLHRQLRSRGEGVRESGAFLLGRRGRGGIDRVRRFACYDDLDPASLSNGYVEFHAEGFARLWAECRRIGMDVLADVHTHPGSDATQSETDRTHPMISECGHIAVILPNYAAGRPFGMGAVFAYEYGGNYHWRNWSGSDRRTRLRLTLW